MAKPIAAFTIFAFLLFSVSAFDPVFLPVSNSVFKPSTESTTVADSDVVIQANNDKSDLDKTAASERVPVSEKTQTFDVSTIDPTPRLIFSRPLRIQRHPFVTTTRIPLRFVRRHPCRKFKTFMMPITKRSYGNDMILSDKTSSVDLETIDDQIPTKWLEFKHKYSHRHHHYHHKFDSEKMNSVSVQKEKKEEKDGFMRRVRKFLKHTFD